jgi:hypothetical protein
MNERLVPLCFTAGETGETLSTNFLYWYAGVDLEIVGMTCAPSVDDAGLTIDLNDDGSAAVSAVDCSDQDVPGTWYSTHMGGTNTPVHVDADSKMSFDANNAAANTRVHIVVWVLVGEAMA